MLIDKSSPKSLHMYTETKLHSRTNKFQCKTYHSNSSAKQEYNPEHLKMDCPKPCQTIDTPNHYWPPHCTPEKRFSSTHQNTDTRSPNQETFTNH